MSVAQTGALKAVAFQLVALLERYEQDAAALRRTWLDMDLYARVSAQIDDIQRFSTSLPQLSVPAVALLIAHSEMIFGRWRAPGLPAPDAECEQRHTACIASLHRACIRYLRD